MEEKKRFEEIDIAKGIGIVLVIFGHCFPDVSTEAGISAPIFRVIHDFIYTFHMPLMFFLAGFLAQKIFRLNCIEDKFGFVKARFIRLMIPYFAIGLMYMPVKMILSSFAAQPFNIANLWQIFVGENPDGGLWYLYALFLIQAVLVYICKKKNVMYLLPISGIISVLIIVLGIAFYRIDDAIYYLFFVMLGMFAGMKYKNFEDAISWLITTIAAVILCIAAYYCIKLEIPVLKFLCGMMGSIMVIGISRALLQSGGGTVRCLKYLGRYTMDIYVLHGIIMVAIRIALWSLLKLNYYVCTVAMLVGGLVIPIIISKFILRKSKVLKLLFLGER